MAGQGWFLKFMASTGAKNIININRLGVNYMQQAGLKQAVMENLRKLNLPEKPKKPMSAFLRYMQDNRETLLRSNPHFKMIQTAKHFSAEWANINETLKEKYNTEYLRDMEVYNKKYLEYTAKLSPTQVAGLKQYEKEKKAQRAKREIKKKFKEMNRPKRPLGAFMLYLIDTAKKQNKKMNELMVEIKGQWAGVPDSEKKKYLAEAEERKKHYDIEMGKWEMRMIHEGNEDLVRKQAVPSKLPSRLAGKKRE